MSIKISQLAPDLPAEYLTFMAEAAGESTDPAIREALAKLLEHPNAVVREGAVHGLAKNTNDDERGLLLGVANDDHSEAVRVIATSYINSSV